MEANNDRRERAGLWGKVQLVFSENEKQRWWLVGMSRLVRLGWDGMECHCRQHTRAVRPPDDDGGEAEEGCFYYFK